MQAFLQTRSNNRVPFLVRAHPDKVTHTITLTCVSTWQKRAVGATLKTVIGDVAPIVAAAEGATATNAERAAAHDARAASTVADALLAAEVTAAGLPTIDAVSLTDVSAFFLRGSARFRGELVFQQRLVPYLIESPFSRLMSLSDEFGWFGCVRPSHLAAYVFLCCMLCHQSFMGLHISSGNRFGLLPSGHRDVFKGYVPTVNTKGVVGLTKLKPDGCLAEGVLAFLYLEIKPTFVLASAEQDQCVLPSRLHVVQR